VTPHVFGGLVMVRPPGRASGPAVGREGSEWKTGYQPHPPAGARGNERLTPATGAALPWVGFHHTG